MLEGRKRYLYITILWNGTGLKQHTIVLVGVIQMQASYFIFL